MDDPIYGVKAVVPRDGILKEIETARKKLVEMRGRDPKSPEREAIFRQLVQLDLCNTILEDVHIIW